MHDPDILAFQICWPWFSTTRMKTFTMRHWKPLITVWHHDPERRGDDDSCGWFIRGRHCDQQVLEKIRKRFEEDWDRVFKSDSGTVYHCGYFCPDGDPHLSVSGIALNLFFLAAFEHFGHNRRKAYGFVGKHLAEILLFAENPTDSLFDGFTRKFEIGCGEKHTAQRRSDRIRDTASCIYSWILRELRPWYRHPRWHVHHWHIQFHAWQWLKRGLFDRCCKCGKGFRFGSSCITDWNGTRIRHESCDGSAVLETGSSKP